VFYVVFLYGMVNVPVVIGVRQLRFNSTKDSCVFCISCRCSFFRVL